MQTQESGAVVRHRFVKAGVWRENEELSKNSQTGFPFLKYQSLALMRECGSGDIFMVGVNNDRRLRCGGLVKFSGFKAPTRVDLVSGAVARKDGAKRRLWT